MKIFIDPGHGGNSVGASYKGRIEQDDTFRLSLAVGEILKENGAEVLLSRGEKQNPSITERTKTANSFGADYFLSIHRNAFCPNEANGAEIWCYSKIKVGGETYKIAENILKSLCECTGFRERGVKLGAPAYKDYGVNRFTKMSSALLEVGFIDSDEDNKIFDEKFTEMAFAIANGILMSFGKEIKIPVIIGDVDSDGKVTSSDARLILRASVGLGEIPVEKADIDGDGKITASDARAALRIATGLNNKGDENNGE